MSKKEWMEVRLEVDEELRESVSNRLFEIGAEGVSEIKDKGVDLYQVYFPKSLEQEVRAQLKDYQVALKELFPKNNEISFQFLEVPEDNWSDKYKEFYKAQKLTQLFFLKPAWDKETIVPQGMISIVMDPGQAFGTGLHPSTRMCIHMLEHSMRVFRFPEKMRLIDVGTGTGILAMVATHLGVGTVEAIDNDEDAVITARENLLLNKCSAVTISDKPLASHKQKFNIIVSNILLETHRLLAPEYAKLLEDGGELILSGLLAYQKRELEDFLLPLGFVPMGSCHFQEWAAFSYTCRQRK